MSQPAESGERAPGCRLFESPVLVSFTTWLNLFITYLNKQVGVEENKMTIQMEQREIRRKA